MSNQDGNNGNELTLFTNEELEGIQPTGSAWQVTPDDPATVPIPLQTIIVKVDGPYNERDRKLWAFLVHAVFDDLGTTMFHELKIRDINRVFRDVGGDHNTKWIWDSARRLAKTTVEWESTFDDDRFEQGISSMFGAVLSKSARSSGVLKFNIPPFLIPIIKQPMRFARLRIHFLMQLSGKYAVTLYEILEGFANRRDGKCEVSVDELRTWLKVKPTTYKNWKDFRKWVLDPALKQINDDPAGAGFSVTYKCTSFDGKSRPYEKIIFTLKKSNIRALKDKQIKDHARRMKALAESQEAGRPLLSDRARDRARDLTGHILDMQEIERQFWAFWENKGRPDFEKGVDAAFVGFAKKKARDER